MNAPYLRSHREERRAEGLEGFVLYVHAAPLSDPYPPSHGDVVWYPMHLGPSTGWMASSTYDNVELTWSTKERVLSARWHALDTALRGL